MAAAPLTDAEIRAARRRINSSPLKPYDNLESAPFPPERQLALRIARLIEEGYAKLGARSDLARPDFGAGSRQFQFLLHAWDPLAPVLHAQLIRAETRGLRTSMAYADAWMGTYQEPAYAIGVEALIADSRAARNDAWEGMATGQRAFRLAALIDAAARSDLIDDAAVGRLLRSLKFHHEVLAAPKYFQSWSNHGLYQALGHLAAAMRLPWFAHGVRRAALARQRLMELLTAHFDAEGVHLEHSPTYHANLLGSLTGARNCGLLQGSAAEGLLARAERALSWMVTPNGELVPFGDSLPTPVREDLGGAARFRDSTLRYLVSDGQIGDPPASGVVHYRSGGYGFARIYDRDGGEIPAQASYLAQAAAFHSRVHKHADHLTFAWSEGARDIIVEPGRYGYLGRTDPGGDLHAQGFWYGDPKRLYVESTRAHNCVEVDGRSHPRKGVKPFGPALLQAEQQGELVLFHSKAPLDGGVTQARTLVLSPRRWLLVLDQLTSADTHTFRQWLQLAAEWNAQSTDGGYGASQANRSLSVVDLTGSATAEPVRRGQEEPDLQGWVSPRDGELKPVSSLAFRREGAGTLFATLLALDVETVEPAGVDLSPEDGRVAWTQDGRAVAVTLSRDADGLRAALV